MAFPCLDPSSTSAIDQLSLTRLNGLTSSVSRFVSVTPLYAPPSDGKADNIYITRSYDATSHFETVVEDVQDVWKRVVGSDLVLKKREVEAEP